MANFKAHVTFSTLTGIAYGGGLCFLGVPFPTGAIAGGACAMAGMLPDIDSKSSRSLQECLYLAAGLAAILVLNRLREFPINNELVVLVGAIVFLFVRYVVGWFVRHFTVHRGMMHSIPTALIAGEITFLLSSGTPGFRIIKAAGLTLGFLSHLVLDEIYSINAKELRLKKSFGTALKLFSPSAPQQTLLTYGLLGLFLFLACNEPRWTESLRLKTEQFAEFGKDALQKYSDTTYGGGNSRIEALDQALAKIWKSGGSSWVFGKQNDPGIREEQNVSEDGFEIIPQYSQPQPLQKVGAQAYRAAAAPFEIAESAPYAAENHGPPAASETAPDASRRPTSRLTAFPAPPVPLPGR